MSEPERFESWAVLELMGHVRMAGRVTEEERFGHKLGRIDVPKAMSCPDCRGRGCEQIDTHLGTFNAYDCDTCKGSGTVDGFTTVYFGGASVYRMTPTTEEIARSVAVGSQPRPVHQYELPAPRAESPANRYDSEDDRYHYRDDDGEDDSRGMEF